MQVFTQDQIEEISQSFDSGSVVAVPTETVYGLAVKLGHENAIRKLLRIKNRKAKDDTKFLTLMLPNKAAISDYAILSERAKKISSRYFPGELTIVLPKTQTFKHNYFDNIEKIGIRIPNHSFMLNLLETAGPLLVTSANLRGCPPSKSSEEVTKSLPSIDAAVSGKAGNHPPSTVVSVDGNQVEILRQGRLEIA